MYSSLATAAPITQSQIPQYFKDATFGVPAADVAGTESPEPGVTIVRDSQFGVPHIDGDTRAALMFWIGYATAEDRLFFIDVLRHAGRGELAGFTGGANAGMDESVWQSEPYTEQDLTNQINWAAANLPDGQEIRSDATNYVDGINAYISTAESPLHALTINAMAGAGTRDLRGVEVLPYALQIIGHPSDPALAAAVDELQTWVASGAHRLGRARAGGTSISGSYDQGDAVRVMDAWWPLLVNAEFGPVLGSKLLARLESAFPIDDVPGHGFGGAHVGSAFDVGFYGIVQKDLRAVLGDKVSGPLNRSYCGGGSPAACRTALDASLSQAVAESPQQVYPADDVCSAGDQMCSDSIQFRPIGVITQPLVEWVNRPTFQQADEIQGHGPR